MMVRPGAAELVARAAYRTDEETRHLVAALQPRTAPREGIRKLAESAATLALAASTDPTPDGAFRSKEELETLKPLLSHKIPDGNLSAVLREAVRCAVEKHGKRRGAVKPARARKPVQPKPRPAGEREPIPAEVRRAVWERDQGRCTYVSPDGHRCESRWQLELDHIEPAAVGGQATSENLRLRCKPHNGLHAEEFFGRAYMARFRRARGAVTNG